MSGGRDHKAESNTMRQAVESAEQKVAAAAQALEDALEVLRRSKARAYSGPTATVRDRGAEYPVTVGSRGTCKRCGRTVSWGITANGKNVGLDLEPGDDGRYVPHFRSCAGAAAESKTKPGGGA